MDLNLFALKIGHAIISMTIKTEDFELDNILLN